MKKAIAVIGEGITEKYYIESLKGISPFDILPQELGKRASSLKDLEKSIKKSISDGYDKVYCLIDMDGKSVGKSRDNYLSLKKKYEKTHTVKSKGIHCTVKFIETERCTELWFLYHFIRKGITRKFNDYKEVEKELRRYRPDYEKTNKYFRSIGSIHKNLTNTSKNNPIQGSLETAIKNAEASLVSKEKDCRNYTYSEFHILIKELEIKMK